MRSLAEAPTFQAVRPAANRFPRHRDPVVVRPARRAAREGPERASRRCSGACKHLGIGTGIRRARAVAWRSTKPFGGRWRKRCRPEGPRRAPRGLSAWRAFAMSLTGNLDRSGRPRPGHHSCGPGTSDSFQPGTNMIAWMFTILRNLFHSEYRKRRARGRGHRRLLCGHPEVPSGAGRPAGIQGVQSRLWRSCRRTSARR